MAIVTTLANAHAADDPAVSIFGGHSSDLVVRRAAVPSDRVIEAPHLAAHRTLVPISAFLHVDDGADDLSGLSIDQLIRHVALTALSADQPSR